MFTGVIRHFGTVERCEKSGDWTIAVACDMPMGELRPGDSVACNGCCLTVTDMKGETFTANLSAETLRCTAPRWEAGSRLHLERAMRLGEALDGHMVSGHVDGLATLIEITPEKDSHRLELEAPAELAKFIAAKGSVALDGVSLTVNEVSGNRFTVNIIPHTWSVTGFRERNIGDMLNLEIDLIARYVGRLLGK
ncbi:MAG: riboflavin synthase [Alphaproteobacteria bacterium]|nr:riboflavin synthase [Alphaproteobacteria bacterium]